MQAREVAGASLRPTDPVVVLIHGILKDSRCMGKMQKYALQFVSHASGMYIKKHASLETVCITYHIRKHSLGQAASQAAEDVKALTPDGHPVFAVACSLGTVILRHMMALPEQGGINWAGCVLVAPPSQGSMVARRIARIPLLGWLVGLVLGKGGRELGVAAANGEQWADPPQPCGVIAGTKNVTLMNPVGWVSNCFGIIGKPNDGTIALEETKLPAHLMTEFITVHAGHTRIQNNVEVLKHTVAFILGQKFNACLK